MFLWHQLINGQWKKKKDPKSEQMILNKTWLDRRHQIITCDPLLHLGLYVSSPSVIKNHSDLPGQLLNHNRTQFSQRSYVLSV